MIIERSNRNGKRGGRFLAACRAGLLGVAVVCPITVAHASVAGCKPASASLANIEPAASPETLPDLVFERADGSTLKLSDLAGRGVVLNFWATWCAPCVREMPELNALKKDMAASGIEVIAASMDLSGHKVIGGFLKKIDAGDLEPLWDPKGQGGRSVGVRGLPTTLIIDAKGREVARILGMHHYDTPETRAYLKSCIGGE